MRCKVVRFTDVDVSPAEYAVQLRMSDIDIEYQLGEEIGRYHDLCIISTFRHNNRAMMIMKLLFATLGGHLQQYMNAVNVRLTDDMLQSI